MSPLRCLLLLAAALVLTSCKSDLGQDLGPRFDPHAPDVPLPGVSAPIEVPNLEVSTNVFVPVPSTNTIRAEWLRPPTDPFRLGPGDAIEIEMLDQTTSRASVTVGPDGRIYYNLLPGLFVWDLTLPEARTLLKTELGKFIRTAPEVSVRLRGVGSKRVWVLGNVQTPGIYALAVPSTLLEILSNAGGPVGIGGGTQDLTDLPNSFVMRGGELLRVDFVKLIQAGDLSQNIYLQPDDFIYLRPTAARNVHVMGAVAQPGPQPFLSTSTILSTLATAGGIVPYAYGSQVALVRGSLSRPSIALVNYRDIMRGKAPDVTLREGDIVFVPFSPFRRIVQLGEEILSQFVRTMAINEGTRAVDPNASPITPSVPLNFNVP